MQWIYFIPAHIEGFCIVSSDSDFTSLAKRIREEGMFVMGMGKATTPEPFKKACEVFTKVELLSDPPDIAAEEQHGERKVGGDARDKPEHRPDAMAPDWTDIVIKAIEITVQDEWGRLADIGNGIRKIDSSFDTRAYGCRTLLRLVRTRPDCFEVRAETREGHPPVHYVRYKGNKAE